MVYRLAIFCLFLLAPIASAQQAAPRLVRKGEPEYSEEARKARLNGTVVLYVVIRPDGHAKDMHVIRSLGLGLDEKAMESVAQWQFQPGIKEGSAVPVQATIEVNFRLLPNHGFEPGWHMQRVAFQLPDGVTRPVLEVAKFPPNGDPAETGSVTIACMVDERGAPVSLRVEKSTAPSLEAEALAIVGGWQFTPAMKDGKPVAVNATFEVSFGSPGAPKAPAAPVTKL